MIVHFAEPPEIMKTGGLELAIRSLEKFLQSRGVTVSCDLTFNSLGHAADDEVVHFHGLWRPNFLRAATRCRRERIPYFVSPHGMLEPWAWRQKRWKKWPWFYLFERHFLAGAAKIVGTSNAESQNLQRFFPQSECISLPLGVPSLRQPDYVVARRSLDWNDSENVIVFVSRIHRKKGLHLLLNALANIENAAVKNVRLVIIGGGDERYVRELKEFAERERARLPTVEWRGELWGDEKWAYFQGADLFCLPTYSENFGLAILEALQVGTRVLTTNQTPWSELPSWNAGYIAEPSERSIESALRGYLASPEWSLKSRARLAAEIHERFSWDSVGPLYIRQYEDVLAQTALHR